MTSSLIVSRHGLSDNKYSMWPLSTNASSRASHHKLNTSVEMTYNEGDLCPGTQKPQDLETMKNSGPLLTLLCLLAAVASASTCTKLKLAPDVLDERYVY